MYFRALVLFLCSLMVAPVMAMDKLDGDKDSKDQQDWPVLRIGTEGAYPPFNYTNSKGELVGLEIELARVLCQRMEMKCELVSQDWDGMIPALLSGKYDAIMASMSITEDRSKVIAFSDPYMSTPSAFIARKDFEGPVTVESMSGKKMGAQSASIQVHYISDNFPNSAINFYPTQNEVYLELKSGRIDVLMVDKAVGESWLKSAASEGCCKFVGEDVKLGSGVGVGIRKADKKLLTKFNKAIKEVHEDGTFDKISSQYFDYSIK